MKAKKERGVTLTGLVLYVMIFTMILALLVTLSNYIFGNLNKVNNESISSEDFNKFNANFVKDVKESNNVVITSSSGNYTIVLSNGANYNYIKSENAIYKDYNKIAENICTFTAEKATKNNKIVAKVTIATGKDESNKVYGKTINYVLKYW